MTLTKLNEAKRARFVRLMGEFARHLYWGDTPAAAKALNEAAEEATRLPSADWSRGCVLLVAGLRALEVPRTYLLEL